MTDNEGATHSDNLLVNVNAGTSTSNETPVANAGPNQTITLPVNTAVLNGEGRDSDGSIVQYSWTQYGGPTAMLLNANTASATVSGLVAGSYYFRLTVTDDDGATHADEMLLKVGEADEQPAPVQNATPEVFAGENQTLTLPQNSTRLIGSARDNDGSIVSYSWSQYGGASVTIEDANSAQATVTGLTAGSYYFRLTVTDDGGATVSDNMLVKVVE